LAQFRQLAVIDALRRKQNSGATKNLYYFHEPTLEATDEEISSEYFPWLLIPTSPNRFTHEIAQAICKHGIYQYSSTAADGTHLFDPVYIFSGKYYCLSEKDTISYGTTQISALEELRAVLHNYLS
jgi:hypothetical protein